MSLNTNPSSATVRFNVGGTLYEVSHSLLKRYPNTMLSRLVSKEWNHNTEENGATESTKEPIFIEQDGERFKYILDFMRDGSVCLPAYGVSKSMVLQDLIYYGFEDIQQDDTVFVDCITGDSIKHLNALEKDYKHHKEELKNGLAANEAEKEATLKALREEYAEKERTTAETHDTKKKEMDHRLGCIEVAHLLFKQFQAGEDKLVLRLTKHFLDQNNDDFGKLERESISWFYSWAVALYKNDSTQDTTETEMVNDPVLEETLGKFGLEFDGCRVVDESEQLPHGWAMIVDDASGNVYYYHEDAGETSWERPENPDTEEVLYVHAREKQAS